MKNNDNNNCEQLKCHHTLNFTHFGNIETKVGHNFRISLASNVAKKTWSVMMYDEYIHDANKT